MIKDVLPEEKTIPEPTDSSCKDSLKRTIMIPVDFLKPYGKNFLKLLMFYFSLGLDLSLSIIRIGVFYFDLVKDFAALFFFYHLSYNILFLTGYETRYVSVGEINFERLF